MPRPTLTGSSVRNVKSWAAAGVNEHFVQFYRTDEYLIECLAGYVAKGLQSGETVVVVATPAHRVALEDRLRLKTVDVARSIVDGLFIALDAEELLSKFMVDGRPNRAAFEQSVTSALRNAAARGRRIRVFGEMVALLWARDNREGAIELEQLWNELGRELSFSLYCAYPAECTTPKDGRPGLEHICSSHQCVISLGA